MTLACFISTQNLVFSPGILPLSLIYKLYRYVPPHQVGFLHRFGLKTGIHFAHFGLELGVVFEGTKLSSFCLRSGILSDNEVF